MIYDQQNMIKCFEERNFYRLLFAFFQSFVSSFGEKIETKKTENEGETAGDRTSYGLGESRLTRRDHLKKFAPPLLTSLAENQWNPQYTRWRSRKVILFGRSEMKRLFRKVLFMKSESLLFAQIFLIPLAAFFGILYTFWTFSVSSTMTSKEYVPIAQQHQLHKFSPLKSAILPTSLPTGKEAIQQLESEGLRSRFQVPSWAELNASPLRFKKFINVFSRNLVFEISQKSQGYWGKMGTKTSREVFFSTEPTRPDSSRTEGFMTREGGPDQKSRPGSGSAPVHPEPLDLRSWGQVRPEVQLATEPNFSLDSNPEDLIEFDEQQSMQFTPFFTSYKVDLSPTPGFADFLRFTNLASKIFLLWATLAVLRSLRPVKANRPELQIQTRFLRPFQNRKRFRDLEGIEKFSGVLATLTESLKGSFKDPLFYLALILPNLPFFQPVQKGIGKFRFFLFYGKQTAFLRKSMTLFTTLLFPQERQKQAQSFPKGYLFIGPPGTGKTLLAQAIAGESKVNFICLSASEIQKQVDIGTRIGALRLRNLFEEARTSTPCILFFDEIDTLGRARFNSAVARKRGRADHRWLPRATNTTEPLDHSRPLVNKGSGQEGLRTERPESSPVDSGEDGFSQTSSDSMRKRRHKGFPSHDASNAKGKGPGGSALTQEIDLKLFTEFLVQMDSFSVKDGFLVIGTTNFLSSLDPAFVRSGRFDRILGLGYPPKQTRIAILKLHIQKKGSFFDSKLPWNIFGLKTKDLSPADLAKIVNESSLYLVNQLNELTPTGTSTFSNQHDPNPFLTEPKKTGPESLRDQVMNRAMTGGPPRTPGPSVVGSGHGLLRVSGDLPFCSYQVPSKHLEGVSSRPPSRVRKLLGPGVFRQVNLVSNTVQLLVNVSKAFLSFQPGLTHTSQSLREGFVKILESKK
jgi:hypothetical protein